MFVAGDSMEKIERKFVDWSRTSKNLKLLRNDNLDLRRYVCFELKTKRSECEGKNCDTCRFDMDHSISQAELAEVFSVSESMVANWETGRSEPSIDDLLFYAKICNLTLDDILVFQD